MGQHGPFDTRHLCVAFCIVLVLGCLFVGLFVGYGYNKKDEYRGPCITDDADQEKKQECPKVEPCEGETDGSGGVKDPPPAGTDGVESEDVLQRHYPYQRYRHAGVSTDFPPCTKIGVDMIARGGSAVDASIAAVVCIGSISAMTSICGGHFAVVYARPTMAPKDAPMEAKAIVARETAPAAATQNFFVNNTDQSQYGGKAIAVCGEVGGLYLSWSRYGKLPWADLFQPTIDMCKNGFEMHQKLHDELTAQRDQWDRPGEYLNLRELILDENDNLKPVGTKLYRPKLARTLERIAADHNSMYTGSLADDIVADIAEAGGVITKADMMSYEARLRDPMVSNFEGLGTDYTIYSVPPPSGGIVVQFFLNLLNMFKFTKDELDTPTERAETYHKLVEAWKLAFGRRSALGDPEFTPNVMEMAWNMTKPEYVKSFFDLIWLNQTHEDVLHYKPAFAAETNKGTAHISVLAPDGSAVSLTSSMNTQFGSKVKGSRTGIIFNNHMDDFSTPGLTNYFGFPPSPSNYIEPNKMPQSSMSPSLIVNADTNNVALVIGGSGGSRIITGSSWVASHVLMLGKSLAAASKMPRIHHQLMPDQILYEPIFEQEVVDQLKAKGHNVEPWAGGLFPINRIPGLYNNCDEECADSSCVGVHCVHAAAEIRVKNNYPDGF